MERRPRGYWVSGAGAKILDDVEAGRTSLAEAAASAQTNEKIVRDALYRRRNPDPRGRRARVPSLPDDRIAALAEMGAAILGEIIEERLRKLNEEAERLKREVDRLTTERDEARAKVGEMSRGYTALEERLQRKIAGIRPSD